MKNSENFDIFEHYYKNQHSVLLSYKGPFDKEVLTVVGKYIKVVIKKSPKASKKIFKIFIELAQNIAYYSAEKSSIGNTDQTGVGTLGIVEFDDYYHLITGNEVRNDDIIHIIEKCETINSLDKEELREYMRKQLLLPDSSHDGANIGLIKVALTSSNPLDFEVSRLNDNKSFLSITVKVDK